MSDLTALANFPSAELAAEFARMFGTPSPATDKEKKRLFTRYVPAPVRFHNAYRIDPNTGCWNWINSIRGGYGNLSIEGKTISAHRYSFELHTGIDPGDLLVCHRCDNPICVNPEHLFLGTHSDNMRDMANKGRVSPKSIPPSQAKLSPQEVISIHERLLAGHKKADLAAEYKVTWKTINRIGNGGRWSHLTGIPAKDNA